MGREDGNIVDMRETARYGTCNTNSSGWGKAKQRELVAAAEHVSSP
jgi:hypothetical protein